MIEGRWDVTVNGRQGNYAAWFKVTRNKGKLGGRNVGIEGSARPIEIIYIKIMNSHSSSLRNMKNTKELAIECLGNEQRVHVV